MVFPPIHQATLYLPGNPVIVVTVRNSSRAKRIRIQIQRTGVVLVVPRRTRFPEAEAFLRRQQNWVREQWVRVLGRPVTIPVLTNGFKFLGQLFEVQLLPSVSRTQANITCINHQIYLQSPQAAPGPALAVLEGWVQARARDHFEKRTAAWALQMGVSFAKIRLASQRSRWGSCSASGTLSFNWKSVFTSSDAVDYLIVHELAHLLEMNHSHRFWERVAGVLPEYKIQRLALRNADHLLSGPWIVLAAETNENGSEGLKFAGGITDPFRLHAHPVQHG